MLNRIRSLAAVSAVMLAATGTMGMTVQEYSPEDTGYTYEWYHDAAKTQYGGTVTDRGCGGWGEHRYVLRSYVPSGYYDAYPAFYCGGGGMEPI